MDNTEDLVNQIPGMMAGGIGNPSNGPQNEIVNPSMGGNWNEVSPGLWQTLHPRTGRPYGPQYKRRPDGQLVPANTLAAVDEGLNAAGTGMLDAAKGYLGLETDNPSELYKTTEALGNMPGVGLPAEGMKGIGMLGSLVGAGTANKYMAHWLKKAEQAVANGESPESVIKRFSKWMSIADAGNGRFAGEISDAGSKLRVDVNAAFKNQNRGLIEKGDITIPSFEGKVTDFLDHDRLYKAVPELKDVKIKIAHSDIAGGVYDPNTNTAQVWGPDAESIKSKILHEVNHAIQEAHDLPRGNSPDLMITGKKALAKMQAVAPDSIISKMQQSISAKEALLQHEMSKPNADASKIEEWTGWIKSRTDMMESRKRIKSHYEELAKYPDTPEGRFAAYSALWGERGSRLAELRQDLTPKQLIASGNNIDKLIKGGIVPLEQDAYRKAYKMTSNIPYQKTPLLVDRYGSPASLGPPVGEIMPRNLYK